VYDVAKAQTALLIHVALVLRQSSLIGSFGNISNFAAVRLGATSRY
jgi:hypothetical protein